MLVTLVWLLLFGFMGIELYINLKFKRIGRATEKHPGLGLILSFGISFVLLLIFPAAGLVVLIASVVSTAAIQPFYILRHKVKHGSQAMLDKVEIAKGYWAEFMGTWGWFIKLCKYGIIILLSPVWGPVVIRRWYLNNFSDAHEAVETTV